MASIPNTFDFLRLPQSIRYDILYLFFRFPEPIRPLQDQSGSPLRIPPQMRLGFGLLWTCKQLSSEAIDVLYGSNSFVLQSSNIDAVPEFLSRLRRRTIAIIPKIDLRFEDNLQECPKHVEERSSHLDTVWVESQCCCSLPAVKCWLHGGQTLPHWVTHQWLSQHISLLQAADSISAKLLDKSFYDQAADEFWGVDPQWRVNRDLSCFRRDRPIAMINSFTLAIVFLSRAERLRTLILRFPVSARCHDYIEFNRRLYRRLQDYVSRLIHQSAIETLIIQGIEDPSGVQMMLRRRRPKNVHLVVERSKAAPWQHISPNLHAKATAFCRWRFRSFDNDRAQIWSLLPEAYEPLDRFSKVPREIRRTVYKYLMPHRGWPYGVGPLDRVFKTSRSDLRSDWYEAHKDDNRGVLRKRYMSISFVSKKIRRESLPMLYNSRCMTVMSSLPWLALQYPERIGKLPHDNSVEAERLYKILALDKRIALNFWFPEERLMREMCRLRYPKPLTEQDQYDEDAWQTDPVLSQNLNYTLANANELIDVWTSEIACTLGVFTAPAMSVLGGYLTEVHLYFPEDVVVFEGDARSTRPGWERRDMYRDCVLDGNLSCIKTLRIVRLGYTICYKEADRLARHLQLKCFSFVPPRGHRWSQAERTMLRRGGWQIKMLGALPPWIDYKGCEKWYCDSFEVDTDLSEAPEYEEKELSA